MYLDSNNNIIHKTCNRSTDGHNCKELNECYKAKVTGVYESVEWTRKYCKARHSEIWMIEELKDTEIDPATGVLLISRYPCLNCMTEVAKFGFKKIIYGGRQEVSDDVKKIIEENEIECIHYPDVDYEDYSQYKK